MISVSIKKPVLNFPRDQDVLPNLWLQGAVVDTGGRCWIGGLFVGLKIVELKELYPHDGPAEPSTGHSLGKLPSRKRILVS